MEMDVREACCPVDTALISGNHPALSIPQTTTCSDASGSFTNYLLKTTLPPLSLEARHRYSEFEALRTLLTKLYPNQIIPPLPEKHSFSDYTLLKTSKKNTTTSKTDQLHIQKRTRMLSSFLQRLAASDVLKHDHIFHRFLGFKEEGSGYDSWTEILASCGKGYLLRKKSDGRLFTFDRALKNPDPHFLSAEDYTFRFNHQISNLHHIHTKTIKHIHEILNIYTPLGAQYNSWSLTEIDALSPIIEKLGEAIDEMCGDSLANRLDEKVSDMIQEYVGFGKSVERLLKCRHRKHAEWESYEESIIIQKNQLQTYEATELNSQKISAVLTAEGSTHPSTPSLLSTINSFLDTDPALTRRNNITKTKDRIHTLTKQSACALEELKEMNREIQTGLDEFQKGKVRDLKALVKGYAECMRDYHRRCLGVWKNV